MPNQPATNKRNFGVSLTIEDRDALDAEAARLGVSRTDVIRILIRKMREEQKKTK